jgi:glycosyltransferase involved in cell wall biosynthesis
VTDAFHEARLFVLPSDYEGLPAVVLEAMAANCPVLCTDCFPAARTILEATEGCAIIEDTNPRALAALIDAHLAQPRPTGLRAVAERYSVENGVASHAVALIGAR